MRKLINAWKSSRTTQIALIVLFLVSCGFCGIVVLPNSNDEAESTEEMATAQETAEEPGAVVATRPSESTMTPPPQPTNTPRPTNVPSATATPTESVEEQDPYFVTQEQYGDAWPFTVNQGRVQCIPTGGGLRLALFQAKGKTYALNGTARSLAEEKGYTDIFEIWRDDPDFEGLKVAITPILNLALAACSD